MDIDLIMKELNDRLFQASCFHVKTKNKIEVFIYPREGVTWDHPGDIRRVATKITLKFYSKWVDLTPQKNWALEPLVIPEGQNLNQVAIDEMILGIEKTFTQGELRHELILRLIFNTEKGIRIKNRLIAS